MRAQANGPPPGRDEFRSRARNGETGDRFRLAGKSPRPGMTDANVGFRSQSDRQLASPDWRKDAR
jgi:hypothetical protein